MQSGPQYCFLCQKSSSYPATSMKPTKHVREGHNEYLVAILVADMQGPRAPVHRSDALHELLNDSGSPLMSFNEILDLDSTRIHHDMIRVGTMKKYVGHDRLLQGQCVVRELNTSSIS